MAAGISRITIEVVYADDDLREVLVAGSNGRIAAQVSAYCGSYDFGNLAAALAGFPRDPRDRRQVEIGTLQSKAAGGGVRLCFYCADSAGHAIVDVQFRSDEQRDRQPSETAFFRIPLEPAAVDVFVRHLQRLSAVGTTARLRGSAP